MDEDVEVNPTPDHSLYMGGPGDNFMAAGGGNSDAGAAQAAHDAAYARFDEARWSRVADADKVEELRAAHAELSHDEQVAEGKRLASVSDDELRATLDAGSTVVTPEAEDYSGTVEEVLAKVGDDPERAAAALAYEQENKGRVTLVAALTEIANGDGEEDETEDDEA